MKKIALLFAGVLILASSVLIAGCIAPVTPSGNETAPSVSDPVQTVGVLTAPSKILVNDKIQFVLPSNPTTGYTWNVTAFEGLTVQSAFNAPEDQLAGAGGIQTYTLSAEKAGTYTFTAVYKRPWESSEYDVTFTQTIVVFEGDGKVSETPVLSFVFDGVMNPKAGETVRVAVSGNPTTGYEWAVVNSSTVKVVNSTYMTEPHDEGMVGYGGVYMWDVTAEKAGTYVFGAEYKRPWMTDAPADNVFFFNLTFI